MKLFKRKSVSDKIEDLKLIVKKDLIESRKKIKELERQAFILGVDIKSEVKSITIKNTGRVQTYLMQDSKGFIKIGSSARPRERERTLQSDDFSITLIATLNQDIERKLHKEYKRFRKRGEWFALSDYQVQTIIRMYKFNSNQNKKRQCLYCGSEFEFKHWAKKYCSDKCRKSDWEQKNNKKLKI